MRQNEGDCLELTLTSSELDRLSRSPLFVGCPQQDILMALSHEPCCVHSYDAGQILYEPHQFQRCLGVLLTGSVRVTRDSLVISVLAPGDLFGAAALFNDRPDYATTLTACSPCRVVLFPQELLSRLMDADPRIRDNYIRYLSGRIRFLSSKIRALSADSTEGKLKQYLLTTVHPEQPRLDCPASELARRLGISRASLYRAFDVLESQGLILREGRSIFVPDLRALEDAL